MKSMLTVKTVKVRRRSVEELGLAFEGGIVGAQKAAVETRVEELGNFGIGVVGDLDAIESAEGM